MKRFLYIIIVIFITSFSSCEKDELTLPAEVNFEFSMESHHSGESATSMYGFDIDEGTIVINSIEFDGRRDAGEDYYFTSQFASPLMVEMHTGNTNQTISFDIPQGVYNKIELSFSLGNQNESALLLFGKFQQGPFIEVPVRFEYAFQEQIQVRATDQHGNEQIVLKKDTPSTANVIFNTPVFFQLININMLENAVTIDIEGIQTILINNEVNIDIFNLLATQLDNSMSVIFE